MDYREALRKCRIQLDVKQRDLADHIGIDNATLSRIEKRRSNMEVERFFCACRFLGISAEKLMAVSAGLDDNEAFTVDRVRLGSEYHKALVMPDDSMVRADGSGIPFGAKVMYDPCAEAKPRDCVVIRDTARNVYYVRQLIDDMGETKIKAFNESDYETRPLGSFIVEGVVTDVCLGDSFEVAS